MDEATITVEQASAVQAADTIQIAEEVLVEEMLVEEISIDGMCGVY